MLVISFFKNKNTKILLFLFLNHTNSKKMKQVENMNKIKNNQNLNSRKL